MLEGRVPQAGRWVLARKVSEAEFAATIARSDERLRALAYHLLGSRDAMDDALQEAYVKAHRRLGSFRGESSLATWLYRIVLTTCLDALRQRQRTPTIAPDDCLPPAATDAAPDDDLALRDQLHRALLSLPAERCVAVLLVLRDGYSYAEAARVLDVPVGTVASRVALARKQLVRELSLEDEGGTQR